MFGLHVTWHWPWLLAVCPVICILLVVFSCILANHSPHKPDAINGVDDETGYVYSLSQDLDSESTNKIYKLWKRFNLLGSIVLAAILCVTTLLAARPSTVDQSQVNSRSRDIVLCLDVSGSTLPYDREVLKSYLALTDNFRGERIALSIFNSTSRTVFPLTNDYDLVHKQLSRANEILKGVQSQHDIDTMSEQQYQDISDWLEGTQNRKDTTSLIGDGLISCAAMLPQFTAQSDNAINNNSTQKRNSSIVLATDNITAGKATYTLQEALDLTHAAGISVDGMYSGPQQNEQEESTKQMQSLIETHGGIFLLRQGNDSINSLVTNIERKRGGNVEQVKESNLVDAPGWWTLAISILVVCYLALVWRIRR
jgi:Ca-activated chloride channel homolog